MEEKLRKQRKVETAEERTQRLEREQRRRADDMRAEDAAADAMVNQSIARYGP